MLSDLYTGIWREQKFMPVFSFFRNGLLLCIILVCNNDFMDLNYWIGMIFACMICDLLLVFPVYLIPDWSIFHSTTSIFIKKNCHQTCMDDQSMPACIYFEINFWNMYTGGKLCESLCSGKLLSIFVCLRSAHPYADFFLFKVLS